MGEWKRVLLSGSNFHVNALTASVVSDIGSISLGTIPENRRKVVTINDSNQLFSITGSYGDAGPGADDINWFPANTNMDLQGINFPIGTTGRNIFLRKSETFGNPAFNGACNIFFYTSGSAGGLNDNTDFTFAILREAGFDSTTTFSHQGEEDLVLRLSGSFEEEEVDHNSGTTSSTRPSFVFDYFNRWTNEQNLRKDNTGTATCAPNPSNSKLVLGFSLPQIGIPLNAILTGIEFQYRAGISSGTETAFWAFAQEFPFDDLISDTKSQNFTGTTPSNRTLGGEDDLWGIAPQPGNTHVRIGDLFALGNSCFLRGLFPSPHSGTITLTGTNSFIAPSLKIWYKYAETDFVVKSTDGNTFQNVLRINMGNNLFFPLLDSDIVTSGIFYNTSTGHITKGVNIEATPISTKKVKKNITSLPFSVTSDFNKLRPVSFSFKSSPNKIDLGFIAEEVAEINPLLAKFDKNKNPINIDDRAIMAFAVAKLQQLEKELNNI